MTSAYRIDPELNGEGLRIGLVVARFNPSITKALETSCLRLFAIFYAYSFRHLGPTELFAGNLQNSFVDFFYFSITTYTTLGIGDVYPLGNMRIVVGLQSLVGLMLIAWTATFKLGYLFKIKK